MLSSKKIKENFIHHLQEACEVIATSRILLAVSGGADSMVMTDLFIHHGFNPAVLHCNFMLRNEESEEDERALKIYCEEKGLRFFSRRFDVKENIKTHPGISIQMAARELRYTWFEEVRIKEDYDFIATAHHQSDVFETFLINFTKGTGIAGLHGILSKKNHLIRPVLFLSKDEIYTYAKEENIFYREDSSNTKDDYLRNKIRLNLIPEFKKINSEIEKTAAENIRKIKEVEDIFIRYLQEAIEGITKESTDGEMISINGLSTLLEKHPSSAETLFYEIFKRYGFNAAICSEILRSMKGHSGLQFFSDNYQMVRDRKYFIIKKTNLKPAVEDKIISIKKGLEHISNESFELWIHEKKIFFSDIIKSPEYAYLNARLLKHPLHIRKWKNGDFFYPSGDGKKKKISDYLIDKKISRLEKNDIKVMLSENDIVWILGHRIDNRYKFNKQDDLAYIIKISIPKKQIQ